MLAGVSEAVPSAPPASRAEPRSHKIKSAGLLISAIALFAPLDDADKGAALPLVDKFR